MTSDLLLQMLRKSIHPWLISLKMKIWDLTQLPSSISSIPVRIYSKSFPSHLNFLLCRVGYSALKFVPRYTCMCTNVTPSSETPGALLVGE